MPHNHVVAPIPILLRHVGQCRPAGHANDVDDTVDPSELSLGVVNGPFHVDGISSIPNEGYAPDLSSYGLGPLTNEIEYQDASAVLGQDMADLSTHTLTPTSDDEPSIVDPRHPGIVRNQGCVSHEAEAFLEYDRRSLYRSRLAPSSRLVPRPTSYPPQGGKLPAKTIETKRTAIRQPGRHFSRSI